MTADRSFESVGAAPDVVCAYAQLRAPGSRRRPDRKLRPQPESRGIVRARLRRGGKFAQTRAHIGSLRAEGFFRGHRWLRLDRKYISPLLWLRRGNMENVLLPLVNSNGPRDFIFFRNYGFAASYLPLPCLFLASSLPLVFVLALPGTEERDNCPAHFMHLSLI
jgi:hypothetical protein